MKEKGTVKPWDRACPSLLGSEVAQVTVEAKSKRCLVLMHICISKRKAVTDNLTAYIKCISIC